MVEGRFDISIPKQGSFRGLVSKWKDAPFRRGFDDLSSFCVVRKINVQKHKDAIIWFMTGMIPGHIKWPSDFAGAIQVALVAHHPLIKIGVVLQGKGRWAEVNIWSSHLEEVMVENLSPDCVLHYVPKMRGQTRLVLNSSLWRRKVRRFCLSTSLLPCTGIDVTLCF
ncbi:unnamed protein product [Victoria cruziana]